MYITPKFNVLKKIHHGFSVCLTYLKKKCVQNMFTMYFKNASVYLRKCSAHLQISTVYLRSVHLKTFSPADKQLRRTGGHAIAYRQRMRKYNCVSIRGRETIVVC